MRTPLLVTACGLLLVAIFLVPMHSVSQAETESAGRRLAFLVGVQKYDHSQLKDLEFAERDIEEFAVVLRQSGFTVVLLTTTSGAKDPARLPTVANIHKELAGLLATATKRDLILVGLAGHGIQPLGSDAAYFCPQNANPTITPGEGNLPSTPAAPQSLLSIDSLLQTLDSSGVGQKLLLMDACRNDPGVRSRRGVDRVKVSALPPETGVLLSCSSGQFAFEHRSWGGGHGAFFHEVIQGFNGQAMDDDEGGVTWDSLVRHVRKRVPAIVSTQFGASGGEQRPNLIANLSHELPVLRRKLQRTTTTVPRKAANATKEWSENGLRMKFCWCPPGSFTMGSPEHEPDRGTDEEQVQVTISNGFWLGKYEVTQGEWERVMGTTVTDLWNKTDKRYPLRGESATYPMYHMSHSQAVEFCRQFTKQERDAGRSFTGWAYRLPTEAEWEYACRAGTRTATSLGETLDSRQANFNGNSPYNGAAEGPYKDRVVRVGSYPPNAWGLHDMHGNVWEWCRDRYDRELFGGTDPLGPVRGTHVVARGGSWHSSGWHCRSASRRKAISIGGTDLGLRIVFSSVSE